MSVKYDFTGKRVLVVGGAGGVGSATVAKFLEAGAKVFVLDSNQERIQELKKACPKVEIVEADLLQWKECREKVDALAPIHHLVNTAAIVGGGMFQDLEEEIIDSVFGVNFKAIINISQSMSLGLAKHGVKGGSIVNISSIVDQRVVPSAGLYSCTKAAVTTLTKVMAVELAPQGIRVNAVRPTVMKTSLTCPEDEEGKDWMEKIFQYYSERQVNKRILRTEEVADVILYLSTEQGEFVNGSDILVDGGFYAS